jgi:hypothetical protein
MGWILYSLKATVLFKDLFLGDIRLVFKIIAQRETAVGSFHSLLLKYFRMY